MPVSLHQVRARIQQLIYSYAEDWKALATVFATLVGLDPERLREDDPFIKNGKAVDISDAEIDFLLDTVNRVLAEPLTRSDIRGSFAKQWPLYSPHS